MRPRHRLGLSHMTASHPSPVFEEPGAGGVAEMLKKCPSGIRQRDGLVDAEVFDVSGWWF